MSRLLKMDARFIFEQVQKMRPSSFSEEERHRYQEEKMMLRQFMLMMQQDQVPDHLSVRDMKTWLLKRRSFLEDFREIIERTGKNHLIMAELAWTTARRFCVSQMEEELLEELDKEEQLSQLFSRKVTLEGLQMFVSVFIPGAEKDVQTFLPSLHSKLLKIFGGIQITSGPPSAGDAKPAELLELEQSAAPLVLEVVDTALKFFMEEPEQENKTRGASAEIGKLLSNSAAPCISQFGSISKTLLLELCTIAARFMVKAIYKRFDECSKSFNLMDYDESYFSARDAVIFAIQDMDYKGQTAATSQAHLQLCTSEGPLEKREAFPRISLEEEMATVTEDVAVSLDDELEELQQEEVKDSEKELEGRFLEEREASPQVTSRVEQENKLLEEREASPGVCMDEEVASEPNDVAEDTSVVRMETNMIVYMDDELEILEQEEVKDCEKEQSLVQDSAVHDTDNKVQTATSSQGHHELSTSKELEGRLLEKREASPQVTDIVEQENKLLEEREASPGVFVNEEVATKPNDVAKDISVVRLETNVIVYMDDELEVLEQEEVEVPENQESLVQDCDIKNKKGVKAFFGRLWKIMTSCSSVSVEH